MPNERSIFCGDVPGQGTLGERDPLRLRLWGDDPEITLKIEHISDVAARHIPPRFIDLLELATYVYCADQATTRGGADVDWMGLNWRRTLQFTVPVRDVQFWRRHDVNDVLCETLGFLSDDRYNFDFHPLVNPPPVNHYLFCQDDAPTDLEEVVLFFGGLDSLAGAIQEAVVDKRRVALVTHRPTEKMKTRHDELSAMLKEHAGPFRPDHFPVTINKKEGLSHDYTQRSRSFLYASLAAVVAQIHGLSRIRFYENGIVSLNLPLSPQLVGAKATRTTHPRVIEGFKRLYSLIAGRPFEVENPFAWNTKTDVIRLIDRAGCSELIDASTSCAHTWLMSHQHPHCGVCSQCIDRRFAVLSAHQEAHDRADGYNVDLLVGARNEGEDRTMLASYVETAFRICQMSPIDFFARFGEAARAVRYMKGSPDAVASKIFELHQRHAKSIVDVIDDGIAKLSSKIRSRQLPETCLLRLVCDASGHRVERGVTTSSENLTALLGIEESRNVFSKMGEAWILRFEGKQAFTLLPSFGAAYLHVLLLSPHKAHTAVDLAFGVAKAPHHFILGSAGEAFDKLAQQAYEARDQELQQDLDRARRNGDTLLIKGITTEMGELAAEMKQKWRGKRARQRDDRERIRKKVRAAIRRAIEKIRDYDRALAAHLDAFISGGRNLTYHPAEAMHWEIRTLATQRVAAATPAVALHR